MTTDKDFKQLVRDEARRSGRRYTEVRANMRPPEPVDATSAGAVAERVAQIVEVIGSWVYGKDEVVRLVVAALVAPGNVLLSGGPGNGMTALGKGVAAAIGGRLVSVDGRTGFEPGEAAGWRDDDVVVISHLDGLQPAAQVAVVEAGSRPAIVLAKRHPIASRMPFPPDDETRDRFLFGADLDFGDVETELRIVNEVRDRTGDPARGAVATIADVHAMRAAARSVDVPQEVRRYIVEAIARTRNDPDLVLGASALATLGLVQATAAHSIIDGRTRATVDDVEAMLPAVLAHRLVRV